LFVKSVWGINLTSVAEYSYILLLLMSESISLLSNGHNNGQGHRCGGRRPSEGPSSRR